MKSGILSVNDVMVVTVDLIGLVGLVDFGRGLFFFLICAFFIPSAFAFAMAIPPSTFYGLSVYSFLLSFPTALIAQ